MYDSIIVGSGIAGSTAARRLAEEGKRNVLVIEKRSHIGGNCYDCMDEHGISMDLIFFTRKWKRFMNFSQGLPCGHLSGMKW